MRIRARDSGSVLVITLLVLGALTVLGLATISLSGMDGEIAINQRAGDQALYVAEAGIYYGMDQVKTTPSIAQTVTVLPMHQLNDGSSNQIFPGVGNPAQASVTVRPAADPSGSAVACGLVGFSDKFGARRFEVMSTGSGPSGASRQVEVIVQLPPEEGLCAGENVGSCYTGGC